VEKIASPSSPMMTVAPAETPQDVPLLTGDIPDPLVPAGTIDVAPVPPDASMLTPPTVTIPDALLPLANGFCQYLQSRMHAWLMDEHRSLMTTVDGSLASIRTWAQEVFQSNEHASYQMGDALAKLHEHGAHLVHAKAEPYTAVIDARTPHGFPLRLTIEKGTSGELIEELSRLEGWLVANGYTVIDGTAA
jgi:hypothetical protein